MHSFALHAAAAAASWGQHCCMLLVLFFLCPFQLPARCLHPWLSSLHQCPPPPASALLTCSHHCLPTASRVLGPALLRPCVQLLKQLPAPPDLLRAPVAVFHAAVPPCSASAHLTTAPALLTGPCSCPAAAPVSTAPAAVLTTSACPHHVSFSLPCCARAYSSCSARLKSCCADSSRGGLDSMTWR